MDGRLPSRMSFIYKCKTSTLTPFVKLRNILNLMYKTYFMYNQPCVQSERFFTNKFCKIIITSTKKSWTTICLMAYAESAIMYNPGCWWDLFKNSPIWSHWLQTALLINYSDFSARDSSFFNSRNSNNNSVSNLSLKKLQLCCFKM